ncbi:hypothetical protein COV82_00495 [Candidatus Peregrinibacteria bacterium CG11_big_fil_rev_8_21_14_0_20_46_8]|nr:MAG: hypothetical protein COV82_00495 [Candidatus Peregrinibacteria bacterium CG11_big_fil_rev_8_21_14_0_20_46_8]
MDIARDRLSGGASGDGRAQEEYLTLTAEERLASLRAAGARTEEFRLAGGVSAVQHAEKEKHLLDKSERVQGDSFKRLKQALDEVALEPERYREILTSFEYGMETGSVIQNLTGIARKPAESSRDSAGAAIILAAIERKIIDLVLEQDRLKRGEVVSDALPLEVKKDAATSTVQKLIDIRDSIFAPLDELLATATEDLAMRQRILDGFSRGIPLGSLLGEMHEFIDQYPNSHIFLIEVEAIRKRISDFMSAV